MSAEEHDEQIEPDVEDFRSRFNNRIEELINSKRADNTFYLSREQYNGMVECVKRTKTKRKKMPLDYRRLHRYDIYEQDGMEYLIKPITECSPVVRHYVANDELFDILHQTHLAVFHGGRNKMADVLKGLYCNVTKEMIMTYLSLCQMCRWKDKSKKKTAVVDKPSLEEVNRRGTVDVIDMQSFKDYGHLLLYRDGTTKFSLLRALKTKEPAEVAEVLLDIFTTFGCPVIVQSNQGREFARKVIQKVCDVWKELKLVHGEYKNPDFDVVNNEDIIKAVINSMAENKTDDWVKCLKFVQMTKNRSFNAAIQKTPFEAMFGCKPYLGLMSSPSLKDHLHLLETEEDLIQLLKPEPTTAAGTCGVCQKECEEPFNVCVECDSIHHPSCGSGASKSSRRCSHCSSDNKQSVFKRHSRGILDIQTLEKQRKVSNSPSTSAASSSANDFREQEDFVNVAVKMEVVFEDDDC